MEVMLSAIRRMLAEADEIAAGKKVRITLCAENKESTNLVIPYRVASYARRVVGGPAVLAEAPRVVFYSRGLAVPLSPTLEGYEALILALTAHLIAVRRRGLRKLASLTRRREGGPQQ